MLRKIIPRWFNWFFNIKAQETQTKAQKPVRFWRQGGGYGIGKPAWMRSNRLWEMNLPTRKAQKRAEKTGAML